MPGLFGDSGIGTHGGLLGLLTGQGAGPGGLAGSVSPDIYDRAVQQQIMQQTYQGLAQQYGPATGMILATHPGLIDELYKPQVTQPGGSLTAAMGLPGMGGGQPQLSAQQQPGQQPAQPGQGTPRPQQGGGVTFSQNNNGLLSPEALDNMVNRRLLGDNSVETQFGRSSSGLGALQKSAYQQRLAQVMQQQGVTPADLATRDAKYPAFKAAVDKLQSAQAGMGQAGIEFQQLFPQFQADLQKYGATQFPDANHFFQWLSAHKGDPDVAPLQQRMLTLSNVYGRAVSTNPASANTDFKQREFGEALNQYWPLAATGRIGDAMNQEIQTAHDSVPKEINRMAVDNGLGKPADTDTLAQAKAAIAKGAPRSAIISRLSESGFNANGL
jgi:hypothetical protein